MSGKEDVSLIIWTSTLSFKLLRNTILDAVVECSWSRSMIGISDVVSLDEAQNL